MRPNYPPSIRLRSLTSPVRATVRVPGSKSITNRALIVAAMAVGESLLRKPLFSDDTEYMIAALTALGTTIEQTPTGDLRVTGVGGKFREPAAPLFIGNSGTSVRFLTAASVHLPAGESCVLDGIDRMRHRPIQDLIAALAPLGGRVESVNGTGCPPVRIYGGGLTGGETTVNGSISSQYLSALMMTAPLAREAVTIRVAGELVSKPYVSMTASVMRSFGAEVKVMPDGGIQLPAPQFYRGRDFAVEPDASNASYFLAAAAVTGGEVTVEGLGSASIQGDIHFAQMLEAAGCTAYYTTDNITISGPQRLQSVDVDLTLMPDMAQTLAVVCLFAHGKSTIRGIHTLKVKETDRIAAIASELRKLGAQVEAGDDYWIIDPPQGKIGPAMIQTYDDHRMAMSFAIAGLRIEGLEIDDPGCVAKTFPDFWHRWQTAFYGGEANG